MPAPAAKPSNLELGDREGPNHGRKRMERLARTDHDGRQFFGLFARSGALTVADHSCLRHGSRSLRAGFQSKTQIDRRVQFFCRSVVPTAVDKERRGAIHSAAHATEEIA